MIREEEGFGGNVCVVKIIEIEEEEGRDSDCDVL